LTSFIVPQAPKFPHKERKLAVVGITRMLCHSSLMLQEPSVRAWYASLSFESVRNFFDHEAHHRFSGRQLIPASANCSANLNISRTGLTMLVMPA